MKHKFKIITSLLVISCVIFNTIYAANPNIESSWANFDEPKHISEMSIGKSKATDGNIKLQCYFYDNINIFQINDPGVMGATKVIIRFHEKHKNQVCNKYESLPGDLVLPNTKDNTGYFYGKYLNLLFIGGADSFGDGRYFEIFNFSNKKNIISIYHDTAYIKRKIQFTRTKDGK